MAGSLGVALFVWPIASALLLTIRWAGRTLYRWLVRHIHTPITTDTTTAHTPASTAANPHESWVTNRRNNSMNKNPASRASRLRSHFSMGPNYPRSSGR